MTIAYPTNGAFPGDAPTTYPPTSYSYDANGNRSSDSTYSSYVYDVENRLTQVQQGGQTVLSCSYDGDGRRLVRVANGVTTHYVGEWYEANPTGTPLVYYPFNGVPIAMRTSDGTLNYLHHDHLGSLVGASDTSSAEIAWARCWPFGQLRLAGGTFPTDRLFTGQVRDLNDDRLYFYQSRHYDASVGRFLQADSATPNGKNPQSVYHSIETGSSQCKRTTGFSSPAGTR